jgi:hypothetical protein
LTREHANSGAFLEPRSKLNGVVLTATHNSSGIGVSFQVRLVSHSCLTSGHRSRYQRCAILKPYCPTRLLSHVAILQVVLLLLITARTSFAFTRPGGYYRSVTTMSNENAAWITTPRQYRPTYSYLAQSTSSNFGVPSIASANNAVPLAKRRRTTSTFPVVGTHSAPTVAASGYTASVLSHDISHPTPNKPHRLSIQTRAKTPSRIPTPTASHKRHSVASFVSVVSAGSSGLKEVGPIFHALEIPD